MSQALPEVPSERLLKSQKKSVPSFKLRDDSKNIYAISCTREQAIKIGELFCKLGLIENEKRINFLEQKTSKRWSLNTLNESSAQELINFLESLGGVS